MEGCRILLLAQCGRERKQRRGLVLPRTEAGSSEYQGTCGVLERCTGQLASYRKRNLSIHPTYLVELQRRIAAGSEDRGSNVPQMTTGACFETASKAILILLAVCLSACTNQPVSPHAVSEIEAEQLASSSNFTEALAMYNRVIAVDAHDARALSHRAAVYNYIGRNDLGFIDVNQAISLDGGTSYAFTIRALTEQDRPDNGKNAALLDASRAIVLLQRSPPAAKLGNDAFAVFDSADRNYALLTAFTLRAEVRKERKQYDLALADADAVVDIDPAMMSAWIVRASIQRARGRFEDALHDDLVGLSLPFHSSQVLTGLCSDYAALGMLELGERTCNEALAIFPQSIQSHSDLGLIHLKEQDAGKADSDFAKALDTDPQYSVAQYGRGLAQIAMGNVAAGRRNLSSATSRSPDVADWFRSRRLSMDKPSRT